MIFGRWRRYGALGAALLFGFAESLQSQLAVIDAGIPAALLVDGAVRDHDRRRLGLVGRVRPLAADGKPYSRE